MNISGTSLHPKFHLLHKFDGLPSAHYNNTMAFSTNGRFLAASGDKYVYLWDVETKSLLPVAMDECNSLIQQIIFSPDDQFLIGDGGNLLYIWRVSNGELLRSWKVISRQRRSLVVSSDGKICACAGAKGMIELWDLSSGLLIKEWAGSEQGIHAITFNPTGNILVSGGTDNTIRLWQIPQGTLLCEFSAQEHNIHSLALSPDGQVLSSGGFESPITLWSIPDGRALRTIDTSITIPHQGSEPSVWDSETIDSLAFSPDGQLLLSGGNHRVLRLWSVTNGKLICQWPYNKGGPIKAVDFNPDGQMLAYRDSHSIHLWGTAGNPSPVIQREQLSEQKEQLSKDFIPQTFIMGIVVFFSTPLFLMIPFLRPFAPAAILINIFDFVFHKGLDETGGWFFIAYVVFSYIIGVIIVGLDRLFRRWKE